MQFSAMETLMIALLVLGTGQWLVHRISILSRLNMPEPVVGGLLATIIVTGLQIGGVSLTFDESMKVPSMLFFFGAVGLAADFRLLKQGGWAMLLFAVLVIVLVALQDLAGVGMAKLMGLEPYYGLIGGSVTMTGGHGTGAAWASVFEKDFGLTGVSELAAASATFGLAFLLGGLYLISRKIITWHIPLGFLAGLGLPALLAWLIDPVRFADPLFQLFSGGAMLGAFFIATDPVSAATSRMGRLIYALLIGLLIWVIRSFGGYPDAVAFSVLLLNLSAPFIDYYTQPRTYGHKSSNRGVS